MIMTVAYDPRREEWAQEDRVTLATVARRLSDLSTALSVPDGGFTVDPHTGADVTGGYAVSVHPEDETVLADQVTPGDLIEYVSRHTDALARPGAVFGGWRDPEDGRVYLDVSTLVSDRAAALALARQHDQLAVFDFAAGRSIASY
jgi:hypothetical protein